VQYKGWKENDMTILWTLLIGLLVGIIAKLLMPGRDGGGIILTMLLGVAGAFVAFLVGRALGFYAADGGAPGIIASIVGALLVLGVYRLATRPRKTL
jgi:uncharacterized membrane protein YeaQ/YmgE (transglycosylase-associated protein family)